MRQQRIRGGEATSEFCKAMTKSKESSDATRARRRTPRIQSTPRWQSSQAGRTWRKQVQGEMEKANKMMPTTKVQVPEISLWLKQNDFLSLLQGFPFNAMMTPPHKSCARLCFQPIPWILTILWAELLGTVIGRIANHSSSLNPVDQKHCQPQFWV